MDETYDLLVRNASIVDGTGAPAYSGSVAVRGETIAAVDDVGGRAARTIDGEGLIVCPGFVDIHGHSDLTILINRRAESKIHQGVTTEVIGNCGLTAAPLSEPHLSEAMDALSTTLGVIGAESLSWDWRSFGDYLDHLRSQPLGINLAPLVGHTTLRVAIMGTADRPPTEAEMAAQEKLLARCLAEGAFGMSNGLEYPPDAYSTTEELIRLGRFLARHDALYVTHVRSEDLSLFDAIAEAVQVAQEAGCRVEISHLKVGGIGNWGRAPELLARLDAARTQGARLAWDQYPYVAWGASLIDYLPHWVAADGREKLVERLRDGATRRGIRREIDEAVSLGRHPLCAAPWEVVRVALVASPGNAPLEGKSIAQIADERHRDPLDVAFDLLAEEKGAVKTLVFCIGEKDVRTIMQHPLTAIVSDGRAVAPYDVLGRGKTHPRYYGTFPRVLGRYVREEKLLNLEQAIHKMTLMPARRMGLHRRGRVAPGMIADLVLFDPVTVRDQATFEEPHCYPTGIASVIVAGEVVVEDGEHTGRLCGRVLSPTRSRAATGS